VRGDVHTGTIDGYWGLLKRGVTGSFHQISVKHLHRYLSEFQFKWNHRKAQDIFALVIAALVIGAELPYEKLIEPLAEGADSGPDLARDGGCPNCSQADCPLVYRGSHQSHASHNP